MTFVFALLFLISAAFNGYFLIRRPMVVTPDYLVLGVIDGDTLVIEGKNKVRLRHVNAPELKYCGSNEAKAALEKLVNGKRIRLTYEIPDPWGRTMALVYQDGQMINKTMISSGLVKYYPDTTPFAPELKALGKQAKTEKLGLYGQCQSLTPRNSKCIIKGNYDSGTKEYKYYLPNCAQYKFTIVEEDIGEQWFCTEEEALKAGYVKAATCK